MKIVSRFVYKGESCYNVEWDGIVEPVSIRGLYEEDKIVELTEAGYKYRDYYGDILTPAGEKISDMPESPCTAKITELQTMLDIKESKAGDIVLSEAEAAKYFDRSVSVKGIELQKPVEICIHTRDELVEYLRKGGALSGMVAQDVRPLNAITAPEALFTVEEYMESADVKALFELIEQRRVMQSLEAYEALVAFLKKYANLGENFTPGELMRAYLSWGVCGLRFNVTDIQLKNNVSQDIRKIASTESETNEYEATRVCLLPYDKSGTVYAVSGKSANWSEEDYSIKPTGQGEETEYFKKLRRTYAWKSKYQVVRGIRKLWSDRVHVIGLTDEGVRVCVKADQAEMVYFFGGALCGGYRFLRIRSITGSYVFAAADTKEKMLLQNLTAVAAYEAIRERTVKCPYPSTVEMLRSVGLSDIACAKYIGRKCSESDSQLGFPAQDAWKYYAKGPDSGMVKLFNPAETEYQSMAELVALLAEQRDVYADNGEYPPREGGSLAQHSRDLAFETQPVEQLEFVQEIRNGQSTIGHQERGRALDMSTREEEVVELFRVIVEEELRQSGMEANSTNINGIIARIFSGELITLEDVLNERDAEFRGCLIDRAEFYEGVQRSIIKLIWVTKVFREIGNDKAENLRHYMFECMEYMIRKGSVEEQAYEYLTEEVQRALREQLNCEHNILQIMVKSAAGYVNSLIFMLIFKKVEYSKVGDNLEVRFPVKDHRNADIILKLKMPWRLAEHLVNGVYTSGRALRYCTLNDYVRYEMDNVSRQRAYCVNATITPWRVIPRQGVSINSYNFLVNFYEEDTLAKSLSAETMQAIRKAGAKTNTIKSSWSGHMLFDTGMNDMVPISYTPETIDCVLWADAEEGILDYRQRWSFKQQEAKKQGKIVKRIPLKADVEWKNYAEADSNLLEDEVYAELVEADSENRGLSVKDYRVLPLEAKSNLLEAKEKGNVLTLFDIRNQTFRDASRWLGILDGSFQPTALCVRTGRELLIMNGEGKVAKVDLQFVSRADMEKLADKGIVYRLNANSYLIRVKDDYILELAW